MNTSRFSLFLVLSMLMVSVSGCAAIGEIFKGGVYVGVIGVVIVIALVLWLISKMRGGSGPS